MTGQAMKVLDEYYSLMSKDRLTASEAKRLLKLKKELSKALKWPRTEYETRYGS